MIDAFVAEGSPVRVAAPAKLNIWLRILAREEGGHHQIETYFLRTSFHDVVELFPAREVSLEVVGEAPCAAEENLAVRAARAYLAKGGAKGGAGGAKAGVHIRLTKRIPPGSGLGGASSDAAATLLGLMRLGRMAGRAGPEAELLAMGATLGSDVPFFLSEARAALAWGRGDRLFTLTGPPPGPAIVLLPSIHVSTAAAYLELARERRRGLDGGTTAVPARPAGPVRLHEAVLSDWRALADRRANDFEPVIFRLHPSLGELAARLSASGALLSGMTGSGAALFAIYASVDDRDRAAATLEGVDARVVRTWAAADPRHDGTEAPPPS